MNRAIEKCIKAMAQKKKNVFYFSWNFGHSIAKRRGNKIVPRAKRVFE